MNAGALYRGDTCVLPIVWHANNPWTRLRGLLGRPALRVGSEGLLIEPCGSVHTLGMRYRLDLVFLDRSHRVVDVCLDLPPWRSFRARGKARRTLEMHAGSAAVLNPLIGEELVWRAH